LKHVCEILNICMLLDKFFCLILKENLLFTFLSFGCLYLGILGKQYFCTLDFCIFNLRRPLWFVCLVYLLRSNIFYWVLFSYCRTPEKEIIVLFLSSFWCTTFIFLLLHCILSSHGKEIIWFLFKLVFYMCISPLFSGVFSNVIRYIKRVEILLYSVSFCPLKLKVNSVLRIQFSLLLSPSKEKKNFLFSYQFHTSIWVLFVDIF